MLGAVDKKLSSRKTDLVRFGLFLVWSFCMASSHRWSTAFSV